MQNDLFPTELISGSVKTQEQLDAALAQYPQYHPSVVTIGLYRTDIRDWYEQNWKNLHKYLDKDFIGKFRSKAEHLSRLWEFHVAYVLLDRGLKIQEKSWDIGPDFCVIDDTGKKVWIEAVACTPGEIDPVPPRPNLKEGEIYESGGNIEDSNRPRVLRVLNAIATKYEKYKGYLSNQKSGVTKNDCFVIAVSGADIEFATYSNMLLKRAVFGVGPDVYYKDPKTDKLVGPFYTPTPHVSKKTKDGAEAMPSNFMEMDEFSSISAVIYCGHHAFDCEINGHKVGDDFLFAYHAKATNPINNQLFKFGRAIRKNLQNNSVSESPQN